MSFGFRVKWTSNKYGVTSYVMTYISHLLHSSYVRFKCFPEHFVFKYLYFLAYNRKVWVKDGRLSKITTKSVLMKTKKESNGKGEAETATRTRYLQAEQWTNRNERHLSMGRRHQSLWTDIHTYIAFMYTIQSVFSILLFIFIPLQRNQLNTLLPVLNMKLLLGSIFKQQTENTWQRRVMNHTLRTLVLICSTVPHWYTWPISLKVIPIKHI